MVKDFERHACVMLIIKTDGRSFLTSLNSVVQSGINVLIWAGDAGEYTREMSHIGLPNGRENMSEL